MQPRPRLAEVWLVLVVAIVGVGGFLAPTPNRQHQVVQPQLHDHAHTTGSRRCFVPVGPSSRRAIEGLPSQSWNARVPLLRMNGKEGDSQEPSREGIDTEGIDARGGDTAGIYGFAREVVEKEEAQAPFRRLRLIGYAVPAFIAIFLAGISLAGMAGLDEFKEVSENLPNPLIDTGVVGVAFYLWVEEVKTKRSSLALLKKQYEEQSKVPNRSSRRQKKTFGKKKKTKASATVAAATATSEQPPAPAAAQTEAEAPAAPKKGMFEGVKETLDAVNKQSYYQALALNKELEEKGVLPPLERKPTPPGGDNGGEAVVAEDGPELAATAATVATGVPDGGGEAAPAAATSKVGGSKRRKKGKGGNKGKRK